MLERFIHYSPAGETKLPPRRVEREPNFFAKQMPVSITERLTRELFIGEDGLVYAFWGEGKKPTIRNIHKSIDQHERVIQRYFGLRLRVKGLTKKEVTTFPELREGILKIPGEAEKLGWITGALLEIPNQYLSLPKEVRDFYLIDFLPQLLKRIGKSRNAYKLEAEKLIRKAVLIRNETQRLVLLQEAVFPTLDRVKDMGNKCYGTAIRRRRLIKKRNSCQETAKSIFDELKNFAYRLEHTTGEQQSKLAQKAIMRIARGELNLVDKMNQEVNVSPYKEERTESPAFRRLATKLGERYDQGDYRGMVEIIQKSISNLWRTQREYQNRLILERKARKAWKAWKIKRREKLSGEPVKR